MAIRLADTARPNNHVDAEHLGTYPVVYAEDVWFADGTRLSEYNFDGDSIQKEELPLASAEVVGKIYQYVGADGTYKNGHFYKCVENSGSYAWNEIEFVVNPVVYSATEPVASDYEAGSVVVYTGEDTTDFKKGHQYKKDGSDLVDIGGGGTEVVANPVGTATDALSKISIDGTIYDVSTIQVEELPTASATLVGKIYQYVGATTASLTNGYFYQCTQVAGSYVWIQKNVQSNDGAAVEYTTAIPIGSDIKDKFYRVNDGTDDLGLYAGNEDAQTTERVALYDELPEEVPHWSGTMAQYEADKDNIPEGAYVALTDDIDQNYESGDYSLNEVNTGKRWIDGKPIYRKVFTGLSYTAATTWLNTIRVDSLNMDVCISCMAYSDNSKIGGTFSTRIYGGYLQVYESGLTNTVINTIVLEYTKND